MDKKTLAEIQRLEVKASKHQAQADYVKLQIVLIRADAAADKLFDRMVSLAREIVSVGYGEVCSYYLNDAIEQANIQRKKIISDILNADGAILWRYLPSEYREKSADKVRTIQEKLTEAVRWQEYLPSLANEPL